VNLRHPSAATRRRALESFGAALFSCAVTALLTWPQIVHPSMVADHFDPYFSVWRLGQVAHALTRWPINLFDGNIFHPAQNTLAYSDATLLQGVSAAPLFWMGLSPTLIYNIVLAMGFVGSGVGMFVLARHLSGANGPALVATTIFTALPYRIEHLMHLELQWAMFVPLSLWAVHRTLESGRWRHGLLTGLFLWLQFLSCVYYGVFLSLVLLIFVPLLFTFKGHVSLRAFAPPLLGGVLLAVVLTIPYALPYAEAARTLGARPLDEITRYSASPVSYLASSELNRLWGWTADRWGAPELRLFPGLVAVAMALAALGHPRRRLVLLYAATAIVVVQLSFGLNGWLFSLLLGHVSALQGFRAWARLGLFAGCAIAVLAALGMQALLARAKWSPAVRRGFFATVIAMMLVEYSNHPIKLSYAIDARPADVYDVLRVAKPGVIVEFPLPDPESLPGYDPNYQAWSVWHWRPMLNGYSGFYSRDYLESVRRLESFPDPDAVATLRDLDVRYVIVHRSFYDEEDYTQLALRMAAAPGLRLWGVFKDSIGPADVFEVER
jgi:hypothetical protein